MKCIKKLIKREYIYLFKTDKYGCTEWTLQYKTKHSITINIYDFLVLKVSKDTIERVLLMLKIYR